MIKSSYRINAHPRPYLGASFKHVRHRGDHSPGIVTLDEALNLIEDRAKRKEQRAYRDKDVVKVPPTREQLLSVAHAQSRDPRRNAKVKMPTFSIQTKEIGDA